MSADNMQIKISTGKELLDSKITKFEVVNGGWIGELAIRNNQPHLYCKDYGGTLVNSFPIKNASELDLVIKPLSYAPINKAGGLIFMRCDRCNVEYNKVDPMFKVDGLPVNQVILRTPRNTTVCQYNLCSNCARDFYHFMCNGKEFVKED